MDTRFYEGMMPAGPELDRLVAEALALPDAPYSTDWGAAEIVIRYASDHGAQVAIVAPGGSADDRSESMNESRYLWMAAFQTKHAWRSAEGESMPHAVCLAALHLYGVIYFETSEERGVRLEGTEGEPGYERTVVQARVQKKMEPARVVVWCPADAHRYY